MDKQKRDSRKIEEVTVRIMDAIFKNSQRFAIMCLLAEGETRIKKIAKEIGCSKKIILEHIAELTYIGIVVKGCISTEKKIDEMKIVFELIHNERFMINECIQDDISQIINSALEIRKTLIAYLKENAKKFAR